MYYEHTTWFIYIKPIPLFKGQYSNMYLISSWWIFKGIFFYSKQDLSKHSWMYIFVQPLVILQAYGRSIKQFNFSGKKYGRISKAKKGIGDMPSGPASLSL